MVAEYSVWQQGVEVNYAALYEEKKDGLHILRLMGQTSVVYVPQIIDGHEVKVIGEYCFSARNNCKNRTSDNDWEKMENLARDRGMNELSGDYIEQVILPDSVQELCSYAFYNCRKLKCIEFGSSLNVVNNDAFMNCMGLSVLVVRSRAEEPTGAQYFLKQLNKHFKYAASLKADTDNWYKSIKEKIKAGEDASAIDKEKAEFAAQAERLESVEEQTLAKLENTFDFLEGSKQEISREDIGKLDQEMLIFVTGLTTGKESSSFLLVNPCDRYKSYSAMYLKGGRRNQLLKEME